MGDYFIYMVEVFPGYAQGKWDTTPVPLSQTRGINQGDRHLGF